MPAPRRAPTVQEINTAFSDMSTEKQAMVLESLTSIHRILKRERSRTAPQSIERDLQDIAQSVVAAQTRQTRGTVNNVAAQALPAKWLAATDLALQQRIAGDTTPEGHEH